MKWNIDVNHLTSIPSSSWFSGCNNTWPADHDILKKYYLSNVVYVDVYLCIKICVKDYYGYNILGIGSFLLTKQI